MTQAELAAELEALVVTVTKIGTESKSTLQKVSDLEAAVAAAQAAGSVVDPAVIAALDALKAQVNVVDALIPDAPVA